jgi:hypothetical protein
MARKHVHLNHHISIDDKTGNVTVCSCLITPGDQDPLNISLDPSSSDTLTFTSNRKDTQIRYKTTVTGLEELPGSPSNNLDIAPGIPYNVSDAKTFKVDKKCDFKKGQTPQNGHFVFECGFDKVGTGFTLWGNPGGSTPGPND